MKVIITGGRDFNDYYFLKDRCDRILSHYPSSFVSVTTRNQEGTGKSAGVDVLAKYYAEEMNMDFSTSQSAIAHSDTIIAFWDGHSKGTKDIIKESLKHGLEVHVFKYRS